MSRVNDSLPEQSRFAFGGRPAATCKQGILMELINKGRRDTLISRAGVWDKARLEATAAPHSGCWLDAPPGLAFDTQLSSGEVQHGLARRLGVPLCEEHACPFCFGVVDKWGAHCESCMSGGDKTVNHNNSTRCQVNLTVVR